VWRATPNSRIQGETTALAPVDLGKTKQIGHSFLFTITSSPDFTNYEQFVFCKVYLLLSNPASQHHLASTDVPQRFQTPHHSLTDQ